MSLDKIISTIAGADLKSYLIVFDYTFGGRAAVQAFFDSKPDEVRNWMSPFEGAVFFVSTLDPYALAKIVRTRFPLGGFLITELPFSKDGWLQQSAWDFVNKPTENPNRPGLNPFRLSDVFKPKP